MIIVRVQVFRHLGVVQGDLIIVRAAIPRAGLAKLVKLSSWLQAPSPALPASVASMAAEAIKKQIQHLSRGMVTWFV